jgi:hypothetical protein
MAALSFVDAPPSSAAALVGWFDTHLVAPGRMELPTYVAESLCAPILLEPPPPSSSRAIVAERAGDVTQIVVVARARVLHALRGFMPPARDERFLTAAIAAGRVRCAEGSAVWEPRFRESDFLSDVVLGLFAADILTYREFHDTYLCVCRTCFRIDFDPTTAGRTGCPDHLPTGVMPALSRSKFPAPA